jgi:hypothetical protein
MRVLLLKYNKVTNESFQRFAESSDLQIIWADLASLGRKMDVLTAGQVSEFLNKLPSFDAIMIGDIFWPTGQEICNWSAKHKVKCFFLQHGQWVYTKNKRSPRYLPYCTCVYGENIKKEILSWPYGKRSRVEVTGNPRYDNLQCREGDYVYFSPPVMLELNASSRSIAHPEHEKMVKTLRGLDVEHKVVVHPHYREGKLDLLRKLFPASEFIDPAAPALDVVVDSKCVLTHRNSTVVLDAMACSKRVVLMNFGGSSYYRRGYFAPFALESSNFDECMSNLAKEPKAISDYKKKARLHLALEGASNRIEQLIKGEQKNVST